MTLRSSTPGIFHPLTNTNQYVDMTGALILRFVLNSGFLTQLLESSGFEVQSISLHPRITPLPGPLIDWLRTFCRTSFLRHLDEQEAEEIMSMTQDICSPDCMDERGRWTIMYCRLRVVAVSTN